MWKSVEWLKDRFRSDSGDITRGWVTRAGAGENEHGSCYVQVRLLDLGIAHDRDRFRERKPVLLSVVTLPVGAIPLPISTTLGPASFAADDVSDFKYLASSNVKLTGRVPFNSGDLELLIGLISVPGRSDLDAVSGFLEKLGGLVKVPELSTAVQVAREVADAATDLLGGDSAEGLIGLRLDLAPEDLPTSGYYVVMAPDRGGRVVELEDLRVHDDRLEMRSVPSGTDWVRVVARDFVLVQIRTTRSMGDAWREMPSLSGPLQDAVEAIQSAEDEKAVKEAERRIAAATLIAKYSPNLNVSDRAVVVNEMIGDYKTALQQKFDLTKFDSSLTHEDRSDAHDVVAIDVAEGESPEGKVLRLTDVHAAVGRSLTELDRLR